MTTAGFYKFTDELLRYAPSGVYAPNYTLLAEDRATVTFPVDGWLWFNSQAEAESYYGINGAFAGNWLGFGAALAADVSVNQFVASLSQNMPVLHLMIGIGLGQASQGDARTFLEAWSLGVRAGAISSEMQQHVIELAAGYQLPQGFLDGLQSLPQQL